MHSIDPIEHFRRWYQQAQQADIDKPHAMTLATVDVHHKPSARMVLLTRFDAQGFVFHTNYESHKGEDLAQNPWAALVFWWDPLGYQVRIEGSVEKTSAQASDDYFNRRPRGSQLAAWASAQSRPIAGPATLEARMQQLQTQYGDKPVPRPPYWGGYRLVPTRMEFWQDRANRLHERLCYQLDPDGHWQTQQLAP